MSQRAPSSLGSPSWPNLRATLLAAWRTSNKVTTRLVQQLPDGVWEVAVPGVPRRTVRMIAAHLHNSRCSWVRTLGSEHGVIVPERVDRRHDPREDVAKHERILERHDRCRRV